jgi:glycosyltransferase involved in cell wall biosynthesis
MLTIAATPAYNEERTIANIISGSQGYVDTVVVIDDGSTDSTTDIARGLNAYVTRHSKNLGYGAALRSCFMEARKMGADRMIIIDSDGQHDCKDIPKLLEPLNDGYDLVIGSRFIIRGGDDIPFYRKAGMKVLDTLTNFIGETKVSDSQSGFRAYSRRAIETLEISGNGMSAGSEILLQINENDLKVKEVDISCKYDLGDTSTQDPITHALGILIYLLRELKLRKPVYYFSIPCIVFAGAGIGVGQESLRILWQGGNPNIVPTALMTVLIFAGAVMGITGLSKHSVLMAAKSDTGKNLNGAKMDIFET